MYYKKRNYYVDVKFQSLNDSKKNVRYYESLSTREKEIFESKIGVLLEMYSKLKDLMFHDVRSFFNFLRGKWSYYSLDRLLRVNIDTFRDAKYVKCTL
jgi:hypothetical protein